MKKHYLFLIFSLLLIGRASTSTAQLVTDNAFLQGHWLEAAIAPNGSWGNSITAPRTYHVTTGGTASYTDPITFTTPANSMDFNFDYRHDGFAAGSFASGPTPWYGPYFMPGTPFDGWSMQVNGIMSSAFYTDAGFNNTLGGTLAGSVTSYSNAGGVLTGVWTGTAAVGGALHITQTNTLDTNASYLIVTTKFINTGGTTLPGLYYFVSADPDNDVPDSAGSYATNNHIAYQNDYYHRVEVWARPPFSYHQNCFTGLSTKDCRAKALIYESWPPFMETGNDLDKVYAGTTTGMGTCYYAEGATTYDQDIAYAIVYNLGSLGAGDSTILSFAWIFTDSTGVDSAFPEPQIVTQGIAHDSLDTVRGCSLVGTSFPATVIGGTAGVWSWSHWTWAPATGLSATTGTNVTVNLLALGGPTTYTITGTDTAAGSMTSCNTKVFYMYVSPCSNAANNSPCFGDTLNLIYLGPDTVGTTYSWTGPHGFTSTLQDPFIFPATTADSGLYHVIKTLGAVHDTDSTYVIIHPLPTFILTNNSPLCEGAADTLRFGVSPDSAGESFMWHGPNGYIGTGVNPVLNGFIDADTGVYTVVGTTAHGCIDSATIHADMIPRPPAPVITNQLYCQNNTFHALAVVPATVYWWSAATGGASSTVSPIISTAVPGTTYVWASQFIGSCQSLRGVGSVHIKPTPPAPTATGQQYCQYIGPIDTVHVGSEAGATVRWYQLPTAGDTSSSELWPNLSIAGTYTFYVFQTDSLCESPSTAVPIIVHPKPNPPVTTSQLYCQYSATNPVIATPSGTGDFLTWFGTGIPTTGTLLAPYPNANIPGLDSFYVNETTEYNCVSDKQLDTVRIVPRPVAPGTRDTSYCQGAIAVPLNLQVDSAGTGGGDRLSWYLDAAQIDSIPVPLTTTPGTVTWYVSQTINNCQSDSAAVRVTTIYVPKFTITPSSPWVCQLDSISLAYNGTLLQNSSFKWSIPVGDSFGGGTVSTDSMIIVKFDSASLDAFVSLKATDDNGKCFSIDTLAIKVVPQPVAIAFTKSEVCLGDTTDLSIITKTTDAYQFVWYIDYNTLMGSSTALNIISANSNSGGPFTISWLDTGLHVIQLNSFSEEGCPSKPSYDTVDVHAQPDASFSYKYNEATLCLEDSVYFTANTFAYNNSYTWSPAHSFTNIDKPAAFGVLEQTQTTITLTVTDPFGCTASTSQQLDPGSCCTVAFPNAFTPNGDGHDDVFRPLFTGYHNFHIFRIQNRWGQTVFESTNSSMQWDGTFNGVPQDMGVYFYYLKYDCGGKSIETSGDVTLIR